MTICQWKEYKIVKKLRLLFVVLGIMTISANVSDANVVSLDFRLTSEWPPPAQRYTWDFDYESQQLTTHETVLELRPDSYWVLDIFGRVDSDTTFSVVRNITNETGITWTGYNIFITPPSAGSIPGVQVIPDSIEFTKFELLTVHDVNPVYRLSGQPFVLNGQSFTMTFDMRTTYYAGQDGVFSDLFYCRPIPEPATVLLLGLGCAFLRWKTQRASGIIVG
jgi:hypothetical protein